MLRAFLCLCLAVLTCVSVTLAHADDAVPPVPAPTAAPVNLQPTAPAAPEPTAPTLPEPTQPVVISKEPTSSVTGSGPAQIATEPTVPAPAAATQDHPVTGVSPSQQTSPGSAPLSANGQRGNAPAVGNPSSRGVASTSPGSSLPGAVPAQVTPAPAVIPPQLPTDPNYTSGTTLPDVNSSSVSAAAPAQLTCRGKSRPTSEPFMVAPFNGWTSINSFLDHDSPDYALDGTIVVANGLTASSSNGQASDFFPSYWSSALRQYISYDGHNGYDYGVSYQPILAAADGTVSFAGWNGASSSEGYGQMVLINHHNGYVTLYGHLSRLEVRTGDTVTAGQEIGISGSTGNSSGPHLHFSVFHNCQVTDPYGWTGDGRDPLTDFNGEHAEYLWLPGHDPLVLNPPPGWPTFPANLSVSLPRLQLKLRRIGHRVVPPIDRLLLLDLPSPQAGQAMSAAAALAVTEGRIALEGEALQPYLQDLRRQGLLDGFESIPAVGAVWVRGKATSNQLEGLPGVASLSGVRPRDLVAAQAGLAHSVLIQLAAGQAPSLWPAGFRSSLHAWRPVTTIANGHALVTGFTLPGQKVTILLHRDNTVPGVAQTYADPQTGGYVAMLHDAHGNPVDVQARDVVETSSAGRSSMVTVLGCALRARAGRISGWAPPGTSVSVSLASEEGRLQWHGVVTANQRGEFGLRPASVLAGGTQAIASFVNAAGDDESITAPVPGVVMSEGSPTIRGWAVGSSPQMTIRRRGRILFQTPVRAGHDGTFLIEAMNRGRPLTLAAGDVVVMRTARHRRALTVPPLRIALRAGASYAVVSGPRKARVLVSEQGLVSQTWNGNITLGGTGAARIRWRAGTPNQGDTAVVRYVYPTGDVAEIEGQAQGITVGEGSGKVYGETRFGSTLSLRLLTASGLVAGSAVSTAGAQGGAFSTRLVDPSGRRVRIEGGERLLIREGGLTRSIEMPALTLHIRSSNGRVVGMASAGKAALLSTYDRNNHIVSVQKFRAKLVFSLQAADNFHSPITRAVLSEAIAPGMVAERTADVTRTAPVAAGIHRPTARH